MEATSWSVKAFPTTFPVNIPSPERGIPASSKTADPFPQAPSALQCRYASWSRMTSLMSLVGSVSPATRRASNSMDREVRSVRSTTSSSAPLVSVPPIGAMTRISAPNFASARRSFAIPTKSAPASAITPTLRPSIGPGSSTICDSAGETITSRAGEPFGAGSPSPAATWLQRSSSTSANTASSRSLISCSKTLPSSNVNASTMWLCSTGVRLR